MMFNSILVFIFLTLTSCFTSKNFGQNYKSVTVPQKLSNQYFNSSYDISNLSPKTYRVSRAELKGKNVANYIEDLLKKNDAVLLPDGVIQLGKDGLKMPSNSTLYFGNKTLLKFNGPANGKFSDIIKVYDVNNVKIYNARIQGSRNISGQTGEWSAGISVLNSKNILIDNAYIFDTFGDGIFIGSENDGVSRNVTLNNVWIDNARRNAISITSVIGASINNVLLSNTHGTLPECGVDIEPSLFGEYIQQVSFNNLYSFNNKNAAFNINLSALNSDEKQYIPEVTISLKNIRD